MTKRMVQGGEATSERRRRDGVYQKSARRTRAVLLPNHRGVHEFVAGSSAWRVRVAKGQGESRWFCALHNLNHTTRANISHEIAEQIRARIACTPLKGNCSSAKASLEPPAKRVVFKTQADNVLAAITGKKRCLPLFICRNPADTFFN